MKNDPDIIRWSQLKRILIHFLGWTFVNFIFGHFVFGFIYLHIIKYTFIEGIVFQCSEIQWFCR